MTDMCDYADAVIHMVYTTTEIYSCDGMLMQGLKINSILLNLNPVLSLRIKLKTFWIPWAIHV